jgi:hypothetical protein
MADDHADVLMQRFASGYGQIDRTQRKEREHASTLRPQERERAAAARSKLVNFKTTQTMHVFLKSLADEMGVSMTEVIERGIALVAESRPSKQ